MIWPLHRCPNFMSTYCVLGFWHLFCIVSKMCLNVSRGLLRDCENRWIVCSSIRNSSEFLAGEVWCRCRYTQCCTVPGVYSVQCVQYCTVPVFLRTRLLTHTSAVSVGPTAVRFTPRCVIIYSYCYSEIKSWWHWQPVKITNMWITMILWHVKMWWI